MRMMRAVKRASTKPAGNAESSSPDGRRPACEMRLGKLSSAAFKRFLVSIKSATKPSDEKKKEPPLARETKVRNECATK